MLFCITDIDLMTIMNWVLGDIVLPPVSLTGGSGPFWKTQKPSKAKESACDP